MPKLKTYNSNQKKRAPKETKPESSGVACTEKRLVNGRWRKCPGEMMISVPHEPHYSQGRAGEPGAIKSGLKRAVCNHVDDKRKACGWRGWV